MTKLPATSAQMLQSKLVNRKPMPCAVCDRYIGAFSGLPVIMSASEGIIEFVHHACCHEEK